MVTRRFTEGIDQFLEEIGHGGYVTARCEVNQVYAQYQHEGLDLKHPRGGRAKYLGGPLMENANRYMTDLARSLVTEHGSALYEEMQGVAEDLSDEVERNAPREFRDLMYSGHPSVVETTLKPTSVIGKGSEFLTKEERVVYDRPPKVRRLTDQELRLKGGWRPYLDHSGPAPRRRP